MRWHTLFGYIVRCLLKSQVWDRFQHDVEKRNGRMHVLNPTSHQIISFIRKNRNNEIRAKQKKKKEWLLTQTIDYVTNDFQRILL